MSVNAIATASANGFAFERRIGYILNEFKETLSRQDHTDEWVIVIHDEQEIRDFFKEQSLNGVDHMVQIQDPAGQQHLFLIQEKWRFINNSQREVSQFLDCCARILARMPDYNGLIHRLWVSRMIPSLNCQKSLKEGQCIIIQASTSQSILIVNTLLIICEILNIRKLALNIINTIDSLIPNSDEAIIDPKSIELPNNTFQPVSNFGEKRVLPITKQTIVRVKKEE